VVPYCATSVLTVTVSHSAITTPLADILLPFLWCRRARKLEIKPRKCEPVSGMLSPLAPSPPLRTGGTSMREQCAQQSPAVATLARPIKPRKTPTAATTVLSVRKQKGLKELRAEKDQALTMLKELEGNSLWAPHSSIPSGPADPQTKAGCGKVGPLVPLGENRTQGRPSR
jgi:hypothetical protein